MAGMQSRVSRTSGILGRRLFSTSSQKLFSTLIVDEPLKLALQTPHPFRNITPVILEKVGKNLHRNDKHPLGIIKSKIEEYCNQYTKERGQTKFEIFDNLSPLVNTKNCFDDLRVGPDHPSRRQSDTYYVTGSSSLLISVNAYHQKFLYSNNDDKS
jgi:phenylalanyl-tRNA synthetase alpha chain